MILVAASSQVLPFCIFSCAGRRSCIGEPLGRQELFLVMTAYAQQFDIRPPVGIQKIPTDSTVMNLESPKPFKIRLIPRQLHRQQMQEVKNSGA